MQAAEGEQKGSSRSSSRRAVKWHAVLQRTGEDNVAAVRSCRKVLVQTSRVGDPDRITAVQQGRQRKGLAGL